MELLSLAIRLEHVGDSTGGKIDRIHATAKSNQAF